MGVEGRNSLFIAPTRAGKTLSALNEILATDGCAVMIDPKPSPEPRAQLAPRDDAWVCYNAESAITHTPAPRIILLRGQWGVNLRAEAERLLKAVMGWLTTREIESCLIVIDEAHRLGLRKMAAGTVVQDVFATCRGLGGSAIIIAQHPNTIPNDVILNCDWVRLWAAHPSDGPPAPHPVLIEFWEAHFGPWAPEMDAWLRGARHRSVATDFGSVYLLDENGEIVSSVELRPLTTAAPQDLEGGEQDTEEEADETQAPDGADDHSNDANADHDDH